MINLLIFVHYGMFSVDEFIFARMLHCCGAISILGFEMVIARAISLSRGVQEGFLNPPDLRHAIWCDHQHQQFLRRGCTLPS